VSFQVFLFKLNSCNAMFVMPVGRELNRIRMACFSTKENGKQ